MSHKHPIIAVTGSSGAGTSIARDAFETMFRKIGIKPAYIEGDCFHRYDRAEMEKLSAKAEMNGENLTHFGPEGNLFNELEALFSGYGEKGTGQRRFYIHDAKEASQHGLPTGSITSWEPIEEQSDLLFYEGLHGGLITDLVDVYQHVDLLIGFTPIINLEWMQKIHRDRALRGYTTEDATKLILDRMHDYMHYIIPQFSLTDINFQRVPTIDTSNPFAADDIPNNDESFSVIHIRNQEKIEVDFRYLLEMLEGSMMSSPETIVVPAGKMIFAMQLILTPLITKLYAQKETFI
ncbi:MAG: phosphoribulokinase [Legionellales bacterium]|nr:phosphoribulokinase [Legionellales bacterium]|tara:strand:- start:1062 stop:1940 length:879 start_codon:yes stop_codon:yes gene_type:complete